TTVIGSLPGRLPWVLRLFIERAGVGRRRAMARALLQSALSLPRDLVHRRPGIDVQAIELPAPAALHQPIVARADAEDEIGAVIGVPLDDLEEAAHPRPFGHRVHDEMVHHMLAAIPPVLPVIPQLAQVLADR